MIASLLFAAIAVGSVPPNFTVPIPRIAASLGTLTGRPVLVNFWASWCHPCTDELRMFVKAKAQYGDRIRIITISSEPHDVAESYLRLWNIDLPLVEDLDGSINKAYAVPWFPMTVLVGRDGRVIYVSQGEMSWDQLQGAIDASLEP
jgi:cytochrome c biogenesis protein CcmG, thiol:disulfide interchange protein DsbE